MLKGLKIVEFEGLAPTVFCGMYFADQGAEVIMIARPQPAPFSMPIHENIMNRGKKCVCLNPKIQEQRNLIIQIIAESHIVIDPYRPGILQKLKLGPKDLKKINKSVVLLRVSGYGQKGKMAQRPGHDLNYLALSGIIPLINQTSKNNLEFPTNYLADFVSSSLGVNAALAAVQVSLQTQQGGQIDCSLSDGCKYLTHLVKSCQQKNTQQPNAQVNVFYPIINDQMYCVTTNFKQQQLNNDQIQKIVLQMKQKNIDFITKANFQVSLIKKVPDFDKQLSGDLKNPFELSNISSPPSQKLPSRGKDTEYFKQRISGKIRPKL